MFKLRNHNIILPKYLEIVKKKGSSFIFSALGGWDKEKKENSAKKIAVGSEGVAEGGFGGNSAFPLRNQIEASPATCPNTWRAEHHRKILFSLEEKEIGRAQNEKSKEYFSVVWRACRAVAGLASLLGVLLKKSSNINQKTPPIFTFCEIVRNSLGAKRLGMVFFRNSKGIFEIQNQSAVGNAEVRRAKLWQNEILQTNLFSFAFSEMLSVFFFDCPKTNLKTIWTT